MQYNLKTGIGGISDERENVKFDIKAGLEGWDLGETEHVGKGWRGVMEKES